MAVRVRRAGERREDPPMEAMERAWLGAPDEALFLERARILQAAMAQHAGLPPGVRQGRLLYDLCSQMTPVVGPDDLLLGRILEEVPDEEAERLVHDSPHLFVASGVPGWLDAADIYVPDWGKLLRVGIGGLLAECDRCLAGDEREGVRLSLQAVSVLAQRTAEAARRAATLADEGGSARLRAAADACAAIQLDPPRTLREALQLFVLFHTVLARVVGARNVTPGRMDQFLRPFYERDLATGTLCRSETVELLAGALIALSQGSGHEAVDWASTKRTPCRYSHYYVTLGGLGPEGDSGVNDLSYALLEARRRVRFREPTLCFRYFPGMEERFWLEALRFIRDGLPGMVYNDVTVVAALAAQGVPAEVARDYCFCGCLHSFLPGRQTPPKRRHYNAPAMLLSALRREAQREGAGQDAAATWEAVVCGLEREFRVALGGAEEAPPGSCVYPLVARPLFDGWADPESALWAFTDEALVGVATVVDSLLAMRSVMGGENRVSAAELVAALDANFAGHEALWHRLRHAGPTYGSDDPEVCALVARIGRAWADAVRDSAGREVRRRPAFYSWLFHIEMGRHTPATPDGRRAGEPLSADHAPAPGSAHPPTAVLRCLAHLPHSQTASGGTNLHLVPAHFSGADGLARLAALLEGYFAAGGLHVQFVWADADTLRDAVAHPERHSGLLVRVTGFSEYFTRLLPEIQQDLIRRAEEREGPAEPHRT